LVMATATITLKVHIQFQYQHGVWRHYQTQHHQQSAFRTATQRSHSTGKRHRLVDEDGCLLDLIDALPLPASSPTALTAIGWGCMDTPVVMPSRGIQGG